MGDTSKPWNVKKGNANMMPTEQLPLNEPCMEVSDLVGSKKSQRMSVWPESRFHDSNASIGRVLIISEDSMVRDFLRQMLRLLGYDSLALKGWPPVNLEELSQNVEAIFLEHHFYDQCRSLIGKPNEVGQDFPLMVVLAPEESSDALPEQLPDRFRVLQKPLDYRQMGKIMDECFYLKMQAERAHTIKNRVLPSC